MCPLDLAIRKSLVYVTHKRVKAILQSVLQLVCGKKEIFGFGGEETGSQLREDRR